MKHTLPIIVATVLASSLSQANTQWSGELMLGVAEQELSSSNFSISGDDRSYGIRLAYSFNTNFALEFSYQNYGEAEETFIDSFGDTINDKWEFDALSVGIKASHPISKDFHLVGRLGISKWDGKFTETDSAFPGEIFSASDERNDIYAGIGLEFNINETVFSNIEFTMTNMETKYDVDNEVSNIAISIGKKF